MQKLTPHAKLFSESWNLYKKNWMNWGLILLIPIVFIMVTPAIFAVRSWILLLVWILLATVLQVWSELTLLMSVAGTGKKMNPIDAYKHS